MYFLGETVLDDETDSDFRLKNLKFNWLGLMVWELEVSE